MANIWLDSGGDYYDTGAVAAVWGSGSSATVQSGTVRTGANALQIASTPGATRAVPAQTSYVAGGAFRPDSTALRQVIQFLDGVTLHIRITKLADGSLQVLRGTSTVLHTTAPGIIPVDAWTYIEAKVLISDTVGTVEVRLNANSTPIIDLSNQDTRNGGTAQITVVKFAGDGFAVTFLDDSYINDTTGSVNNDFIGDVKVDALMPDADGNKTQFTTTIPSSPTTHWDKVEEIPDDGDTSYNETSTANHIDLFTMENLPALSGTITVVGVQVSSLARKDDGGARSIREKIRTNATDFDGATQSLSESYLYYHESWEENPDTTNAWTESEVDGLEAGYEAI